MTTIAFKDGVMAADSQMTTGDERINGYRKVHRVGNRIMGYAGRLADGEKIIDFISARPETDICALWKDWSALPELDVGLLIYEPHRLYWLQGKDGSALVLPKMEYSIGSGSEYALGAMAMGASSERAVEIASMFDVYSGGEIHIEIV